MKILHVDKNHPLLIQQLNALGFKNDEAYTASKTVIQQQIKNYQGIVIRSRFTIDKPFLDAATKLQFIARVGAGLDSIDCAYAKQKNITLIAAPEGNRNAVGEHCLGMLLNVFNKLTPANNEVKQGKWLREENRGIELDGKTIGLIGYGNMGKAFAKKLRGFHVTVLCYDIKPNVADENAKQVPLETLQQKADVISLHTPETPKTIGIINTSFINQCAKNFWLLNTARGTSVVTKDLVTALKSGKIRGAGLDVLEYEKKSFENLFTTTQKMPEAFRYLTQANNVLLTPHIAGWTTESKLKLAETIIAKIKALYSN